MNYCSNCGSDNLEYKIPKDDHRKRIVCEDCGFIFYDNPQIVVGSIPVYNAKILLAKRGIEPQKGKWNIPAGFLEKGESIEDGAKRETIEETACEIEKMSVQSFYYSKSHHLYVFYISILKSNHFETNFESPEIKFFSEDEIPWNDLAFESNVYALKKYLNENKDSKDIYFKTEKF